jgi:transposase InsO family protein
LHFKELLWDLHQVKISYNALRVLLLRAGFVSPKKHRQKKFHPRRPPKEAFGEMLQTDASSHQFFLPFGDTKFYALHGFIDDATGTITGLYITKNECSDGYFEALRYTLTHFGCPASVYADGLSLFFSNKRETLSKKDILAGIEERRTQFGQIFYDLGIELIHARSSQAKGKIERLWQTLQSRLITEFKIHGIDSVEKANAFLPEYIAAFNKKFAKPVPKSIFLPLPKSIDLGLLLSLKFTRKLDSGLCFSFFKNIFKVPDGKPHTTVQLLVSKIHGMKVLFKGKLLSVIPLFDNNHNPVVTQHPCRDIIQNIVKAFLTRNERVA